MSLVFLLHARDHVCSIVIDGKNLNIATKFKNNTINILLFSNPGLLIEYLHVFVRSIQRHGRFYNGEVICPVLYDDMKIYIKPWDANLIADITRLFFKMLLDTSTETTNNNVYTIPNGI